MIPNGTGKNKHPLGTTVFRFAALVLLAVSWSVGCKKATSENDVFVFLVEEWQGGALPAYTPLTTPEIQTILGQAVEQSSALGSSADRYRSVCAELFGIVRGSGDNS